MLSTFFTLNLCCRTRSLINFVNTETIYPAAQTCRSNQMVPINHLSLVVAVFHTEPHPLKNFLIMSVHFYSTHTCISEHGLLYKNNDVTAHQWKLGVELCKKKSIVGGKTANSATKLPSWSSGAVCVTRPLQHNIFLYPAVSFLEEAALDRLIKAPCLEDVRSERLWGSFIIVKGVGFELSWNQHELSALRVKW